MTTNTTGEAIENKRTEQTFLVWENIKGRYVDAITLVRQGEQHFTFGSDAEIISLVMNVELAENTPLQIAFGALYSTDILLHTIVRKGYRVALCDALGK